MRILLLRGLIREARHWENFADQLKRVEPSLEVLHLDLPGVGQNNDKNFSLSLQSNIDLLRTQIPHSEKPAFLLSISLGSMLALKWAQLYPYDFKGIININTSSGHASPFYKRLRPSNYWSVLKYLVARNHVDREYTILQMTTAPHVEKIERSKRWASFSREKPVSFRNSMAQILAASLFNAPKKVIAPQLYLAAQNDSFVDSSCTANLAALYAAKAEYFPTTSHDLPLEQPEWVAQKAIAFAKSILEYG